MQSFSSNQIYPLIVDNLTEARTIRYDRLISIRIGIKCLWYCYEFKHFLRTLLHNKECICFVKWCFQNRFWKNILYFETTKVRIQENISFANLNWILTPIICMIRGCSQITSSYFGGFWTIYIVNHTTIIF